MSRPLSVAVVMPSFNHARFIRPAIDSVLDQDYDPIALLVMDGGSTDGTLDILESYGDRLSFVSRRDRGQSDAINQGLRRVDGDVVCWLNSDDLFTPHAIRTVVEAFTEHPPVGFVYGRGWNTDQGGTIIGDSGVLPFDLWRLIHQRNFIQQPSCFFRRWLLDEVGFLDEDLHYVMDWELWIRLSHHKGLYIDDYFSCNRTYGENKTQSGQWSRWREIRRMVRRYTPARWPPVLTLYGLEAMIQSLRVHPWSRRFDWPLGALFSWGMAQNVGGRYFDGGVAPRFHFSVGQVPGAVPAITVRLTPLSKFDKSRVGCDPIIVEWTSTTGDRGTLRLQENGHTQEFTLPLSRPSTYPFVHFRCRANHAGQLIEAGVGLPRRRIVGFLDDIEAADCRFDRPHRSRERENGQSGSVHANPHGNPGVGPRASRCHEKGEREQHMNVVDLDLVVGRAASKALRQRQYDTFARMEPSIHMTLDVFRQIAEMEETDYTSVRTILGAFAEMARPRTYLEIGTRRGHSLCMVANCAPDPLAVYSFDLWIHDYAGEANPGFQLIKNELKKLNFKGDAHFFAGDSKQTIPAFFKDRANSQEIDLIFVDGDHSDEGARTDLLNVVDHVSAGGLLVFDDITHPVHTGLYQVWHDVMDDRPNFELRESTKHEYGWAIARRRQ